MKLIHYLITIIQNPKLKLECNELVIIVNPVETKTFIFGILNLGVLCRIHPRP
jgi:hypothetical protein